MARIVTLADRVETSVHQGARPVVTTASDSSTLELTYLDIAADLCLMVSAGTFPPQKLQDAEMSPRVGDGLVERVAGRLVREPA